MIALSTSRRLALNVAFSWRNAPAFVGRNAPVFVGRNALSFDWQNSLRGATRRALGFVMAAMVAATVVCVAGVLVVATGVRAQDTISSGTYVTPFPNQDIYQLRVIGDGLADGLHWILRDQISVDARVTVHRRRVPFNSILSSRFSRDLATLKRDLKNDRINIAIVMVGSRDRKSVQDGAGRWLKVGTPGWREILSARVDEMMRAMKDLDVAVYWVGLPSFRRGKANESALIINEVIRERAYLLGLRYVDVFTSFADERGGYSAYGPDLTGQIRLLRERDGVSFTAQGNRKLAHFVERELKRDLKQAKAERSVPLAGAPKEQARINRKKSDAGAPATETGWRAGISASTNPEPSQEEAPTRGFFSGASGGEQAADGGSITLRSFDAAGQEETVTLELVRPAIPASVVALVTRKQSPNRLSNVGDTIIDQIAGGYSIMSSVTPVHQALGGGARSRLSPAQTPFFRVLVKGERTVSKPGRADDFSWPRPEPPPLPQPVKLAPAGVGDEADEGGMLLPPRSPFRRRI